MITKDDEQLFVDVENRLRKIGEWVSISDGAKAGKKEPTVIMLNVPYAQKDEAKVLGARWNPDLKKWYVSNDLDIGNFKRWMN